LQKQIESVDGLTPFLHGATSVRGEMPFFWRMSEHECLEGMIDLALFQADKKKWFILDWKTNRIERDELQKLRVHYRPQIAAYWKAIAELTNQPVSAAIYSTSTGQLLGYNEKELADDWERLRNLPPDDLAGKIASSG